jgi:hypothetical protein
MAADHICVVLSEVVKLSAKQEINGVENAGTKKTENAANRNIRRVPRAPLYRETFVNFIIIPLFLPASWLLTLNEAHATGNCVLTARPG